MLEREKSALARESRYLAAEGLVAGREGNVSLRVGDFIVIKASGVRMLNARPKDFSVITIDGKHVEGPEPSSEYRMHIEIYKARDDVRAVVHTHPPYTLALSMAGRSLRPITLEARMYYDHVCEVGVVKPGSEELAREVANRVKKGCKVILLREHGLVSVGSSIKEAVDRTLAEERSAQVQYLLLVLRGNQ